MGMDNVFPGLGFNPEIHGGEKVEKPKFDVRWHQEAIQVQNFFTVEQLHEIQKIIGKEPLYSGTKPKEFIIKEYKRILTCKR